MLFVASFYAFGVINQPSNSNSVDATGSMKYYDKLFVNARNNTGSAIVDGTLMVLDVTADNGFDVTTSTDEEDKPYCFADQAAAAGAVFRCQIYGYKSNVLQDADTASVAGRPGYISNEHAGRVEYVVPGTAGSGGFVSAGVFFDVASASASVEFFIDTL